MNVYSGVSSVYDGWMGERGVVGVGGITIMVRMGEDALDVPVVVAGARTGAGTEEDAEMDEGMTTRRVGA